MAKAKASQKDKIIRAYMDFVPMNGKGPSNVFSFCKEHNFKEDQFYNYFGSFDAINKEVFSLFFDNASNLLANSKDYQEFDTRNKLLTFYYTFFEVLKANRSYVVQILKNSDNTVESISLLAKLRHQFIDYLETLELSSMASELGKLEELSKRGTKEVLWSQLLAILKFWLDDDSANFEKTDVFIEKSIKAGFDIMDTTPLKSVIDLGKFIFSEKIKPGF